MSPTKDILAEPIPEFSEIVARESWPVAQAVATD